MKKAWISMLLCGLLAACSGPLDMKLSELSQPENNQKLLEAISPEDMKALRSYMARHAIKGDIDYRMTVKQAIAAGKAERGQPLAPGLQ